MGQSVTGCCAQPDCNINQDDTITAQHRSWKNSSKKWKNEHVGGDHLGKNSRVREVIDEVSTLLNFF